MQEPASPKAAAQSSRRGRILEALPLATALASTIILTIPVLSPRLQLYYRDTGRLYYPVKQYIAERLSRGELPLWDPWTEAGVSLLGQISPGLFHPFTLLYLFLPFDLAFKLNHLFALPLAAAGAYWFARKLGAAPWPSALAAIVFGCSGYLVSTTASNLPYALGPASIPAACAGLLWLCEKPSPRRLLGASLLLALCNYSGEPQSALLAAAIGGVSALALSFANSEIEPGSTLRARLRRPARSAGLTALWALTALAISMPAVLPGGLRAHASNRWRGLTAEERALFSVHPVRLLGFAIPQAFDDTVDERGEEHGPTPYWEYFSTSDRASFADAICLGFPAMLLALCAFFRDRRGRFLALGGLVFALAATGEVLRVNNLLTHLVPGLGLFRYTEKMIAPASLLFALAAAFGAERALATTRREALWLLGLACAAGVVLLSARFWLATHQALLVSSLIANGASHSMVPALAFAKVIQPALAISAELALSLGLVALHRSLVPRAAGFSPALACACCFAATMTYASDLLFTANVELFRSPPALAEELIKRAGPSEGRWRFFSFITHFAPRNTVDPRFAATAGEIDSLSSQMEAMFHIEGASMYFSLLDEYYLQAIGVGLRNLHTLFDVRFVVVDRVQMSEHRAKQAGFEAFDEFWIRENKPRPRAFLVARAFIPPPEGGIEVMADPDFDPTRAALIQRRDGRIVGRIDGPGAQGDASLRRLSPESIEVQTQTPAPRLLIVAEHFDPGWRATIDGVPAPVICADIAAIALPVPAGSHLVQLRFWPEGLTLGIWSAALALAALLLAITVNARAQRHDPSA